MHILENYFYLNFNYTFINKFKYRSSQALPTKFNKVILNFNTKTINLKSLVLNLLALELVTMKKVNAFILAKTPNLIFKIKKGVPIGCKMVLDKKSMFTFLRIFFFDVLPLFRKHIALNFNKTDFSFKIKNIIFFSKLSYFYTILNNKNQLNFNVVLKTNNLKQEINFTLKLFFNL